MAHLTSAAEMGGKKYLRDVTCAEEGQRGSSTLLDVFWLTNGNSTQGSHFCLPNRVGLWFSQSPMRSWNQVRIALGLVLTNSIHESWVGHGQGYLSISGAYAYACRNFRLSRLPSLHDHARPIQFPGERDVILVWAHVTMKLYAGSRMFLRKQHGERFLMGATC